MKRLQRFLNVLVGPVGFICLAVLLGAFFFVPSIGPAGTEDDVVPWIALALLIALAVLALVAALLQFGGADYESDELARATLTEPMAQALLTRWLRRSRYYRFMGGVLGLLIGLPFDSNPVFSALAGAAAGGALAEVHVLKRKRRSAAVADLSVRSLRDYVNNGDMAAMGAIATAAVTVIVARLLGHGVENSARIAVATLMVLVAVVGLQRLVAMRPRPALSPELRQADDLLRFLASTQGFTRLAIAVAFFMLSAAVANDATQGLLETVSGALVILGLVWWYRGRHGRIPELARRALAS